MQKSKKLLIAFLFALCAVLLAFAFALPFQQNKSASAETYNDVEVSFGTAKYHSSNDSSNISSVQYSSMSSPLPSYLTCSASGGTGTGTVNSSVIKNYSIGFMHRNVIAVPVILSVTVPAYTVYKVEYKIDVTIPTYVTNYNAVKNGWKEGDGSGDDCTIDGFVYRGSLPTGVSGIGNNVPPTETTYLNYGMLFYNDTGTAKVMQKHTYHIVTAHDNGSGVITYNFSFEINASVTDQYDVSVGAPTATEAVKTYNGSDQTFALTYGGDKIEEYDDVVDFSSSYSSLIPTVTSAVNFNGDPIAPSTYKLQNLDENGVPNSADGTFVAKEAGTYTISVSLTQEAIDGGATLTGPTTLTLTIKRRSLTVPANPTSYTYNGEVWSLDKASWGSTMHADTNVVSVTSVKYKNFATGAAYQTVSEGLSGVKAAGYYQITLAINESQKLNCEWSDGTVTDKTFTLNLNKADIIMNKPNVDEYGVLADGEKITAKSGVIPADVAAMGADGVYGLEYIKKSEVSSGVWSKDLPENAGLYYVRPYIIDEDNCNYKINYEIGADGVGSCYFEFERLKNSIAVPYLYLDGATVDSLAYTTTVPYTGSQQVFELVNTVLSGVHSLSDGITVSAVDGMVQTGASTFTATNMRTYTLTVSLTDPDNTRWATGETDDTEDKIITLTISEAYLYITLAYDDGEFGEGLSFSKGEHETLVLSAGEILSLSGTSQSKVTLDIMYQIKNGEEGFIADSQMTIEDNFVKANIDLLTLPVGEYTFTVSLRSGVSANNNYTLVQDGENGPVPITEYKFTFTILKAEINIQSVKWQYANARVDGGKAQEIDGSLQPLLFNSYVYKFSLFEIYDEQGNKITNTAGLEFTYSITSNGVTVSEDDTVNAGKYRTKVDISLKADVTGYEFTNNSLTSFYIDWEVEPVQFDLANLTFASNFTYDGTRHTMTITNLQIADLCEELSGDYDNEAISAGDYTAGFVIYSDEHGNTSYTCSLTPDEDGKYHLANGAVVWFNGSTPYVTYDWSVAKKTLTVTNASSSWIEDTHTDINGAQITSYLPKIYSDYDFALDVRYYADAAFTQEVNIEDLVFEYELEKVPVYYVKVQISPAYEKNYELKNGTDNFAYKSFRVGSTLKGLAIKVSLNGDGKNGLVDGSGNEFAAAFAENGYTLTASAEGFANSAFVVTYYSKNDEGDWAEISGVPTEAGDYKMSVSFKNPNDEYEIKNPDYYLTVYETEEELPELGDNTDDPTTPDNPEEPSKPVIDPNIGEDGKFVAKDKDGNEIDLDEYLDYTYYDKDGNEVTPDDFVDGEEYTAVATVKPEKEEEFKEAFENGEEMLEYLKDKSFTFIYHKKVSGCMGCAGGIDWILVLCIGLLLFDVVMFAITMRVIVGKKRDDEDEEDEEDDGEDGSDDDENEFIEG